MALIKHLKIYNSNYFNALDYVLFQHNERTGKPVLDGNGNKVMRDEIYLDGINCEPYSFSSECEEVNRFYGKNIKRGEIKEHHFIISYDPKDVTDCGLTGAKAQALSMEFARRCLPGFQVLVCTHMDGHNKSGNVHTHIICNSVRKHDVGMDCYAERQGDRKAGNKLHLTLEYLDYMKQEVMQICRREGLNQVDLLSPSTEKQNDKEYYARQRGQEKMDALLEVMSIEGITPNKTKFQTEKDYLRECIRKAALKSSSIEEFKATLKSEYLITLKDSRGRWSYLHPKRSKYITGRALGSAYEKEALLDLITTPDKRYNIKPEPGNGQLGEFYLQTAKLDTIEDCRTVFMMRTNLRLVIDLQACAKAQDNSAYASRVKLSNLQKMAETILFIQENGFSSLAELEAAYNEVCSESDQTKQEIADVKSKMKIINEHIHYAGQFYMNRPIYHGLLASDDKESFLSTHREEIIKYNHAQQFLKQSYGEGEYPSLSELRSAKKKGADALETLEQKQSYVSNKKRALQITKHNIREFISADVSHSLDIDL